MPKVSAVARYSLDIACLGPGLLRALKETSEDPRVIDFLGNNPALALGGLGVFGAVFLDVADTECRYQHLRSVIGNLTGRILYLTDITDSILDKRKTNLLDKRAFLKDVHVALMTGQPFTAANIHEQAACDLAVSCYRDIVAHDKRGVLVDVFSRLVAAIDEQFWQKNPARQLEITAEVGASCSEIAACIIEVFTDKELPQLRQVARAVGSFLQFFDQWNDLENDLNEGVLTYATLTVQDRGKTPEVLEEIHSRCTRGAFEIWGQVEKLLANDKKALSRVEALRTLVTARYACNRLVHALYRFERALKGGYAIPQLD